MKTPTFFLVPADGKSVRDPDTRTALPAAGAVKPQTQYWLRRVRDGDVTVGTAPASAPSAKPAAKSATTPAAATTKQGDAK